MSGTCGTGPVDFLYTWYTIGWYMWYKARRSLVLWYMVGTYGTRLVHVVQGQLMSGTCGTGIVHVAQGQ